MRIRSLGVFMMCLMCLVSCVPTTPTKPTVYQCTKVWDKIDQRAKYECVPLSQSTLDGPR